MWQVNHQRYLPDAEPPPERLTEASIPPLRCTIRWRGPILTGMLLMFILYWIGTLMVVPWVRETLDHWNTGTARLSHYRLNVGHHGTSDLFTMYIHGEAVVIEFPGGDPAQAHTYAVPVAGDNSSAPRVVSLQVTSLNPNEKPGKPDLLVEVEGIPTAFPLYNTGDAFQTQAP